MSFFEELKRRNVFRAGAAYLITAWLIAQIAGLAADSFFAPDWVMKMIITVLMLGFPIALVMAWAYEMTPEGLRRDSQGEDDRAQARGTSRLNQTIIIALSAALVYFAFDKFAMDPRRDAAMLDSVEAVRPSIAVLPFVNMSEETGNEYFADGLSEELLNVLVKIPDLRVAARTSSFSFRGKDLTIAEIARALNVTHVLEGSVRKSGNKVRITAQLIKADDGFHLWSENYDRTLDDIFVIQDEIAGQVSRALRVTLLEDTQAARAVDPESYELYLRGLHFLRERGPENMPIARDLLLEALEHDPENAMAWDVLSQAYVEMVGFGLMPRATGLPLVRQAMDNAKHLAPEDATILAHEGFFKKNLYWDWEGAQADLNRAHQIEPNNEIILGWLASLSGSLGKLDEAVLLYEQIMEIDPLNLSAHSALGLTYTKVGRYDDAMEVFKKQLQLAPNYHWAHSNTGKAWLFKGDPERALLEIQKNPDNQFKDVALSMVYYSLRQEAAAQAQLDELISEFGEAGFAGFIASVFAWRGEKDDAFRWLEISYQNREASIAYLLGDKAFYSLLDDPRWVDLLKKTGLHEYWLAMPPEYGGPPSRQTSTSRLSVPPGSYNRPVRHHSMERRHAGLYPEAAQHRH